VKDDDQMVPQLLKKLLNSTVLNSIEVHRQVTERNIEQLYRIQLVEDLFMKHAQAAGKQSVPGRHKTNNTIPRPTKIFCQKSGTQK